MNGGKPFSFGRILSIALIASICALSVPAVTWACTCCACDFGGGDVDCGISDTDCGECILLGGVPAPNCDACGSDPECMGGQTLCNGDPQMCESAAPTGGCCGRESCVVLTAVACAAADGVYRGDGTDCTEPCKAPNGEECGAAAECESTFCVDGVCCESACDGPNEICDAPEERGMCVASGAGPQPAPAPTLDPWALALTAALLGIIGFVAVRRKGVRSSGQ